MIPLRFIVPLIELKVIDTAGLALEVAGGSAIGAMAGVGKMIGSIFLLFVIFYYVSSILDGGKFQVKMLYPLLIYVCVCNFSLVSSPVLSLASSIKTGCVAGCTAAAQSSLSSIAGGESVSSAYEAFMVKYAKEHPESEEVQETIGDVEMEEVVGDDGKKRHKISDLLKNVGSTIKEGFLSIIRWTGKQLERRFLPSKNFERQSFVLEFGLPGVIGVIMNFLTNVMSVVYSALGGLLTAVVVAFGPITWAFAIFPGNQRVLGSWAIRICQFSLYAPLCSLMNAFCMGLLSKFAEGDASVLGLIALLVVNFVALTSVPTIASMIIEGASGSMSLTSGLQTAGATIGAVAGLASAPFRGGYGLANKVADLKATLSQGFEGTRDLKALNAQRDQADAMTHLMQHFDPTYRPPSERAASGGSGQNPNSV